MRMIFWDHYDAGMGGIEKLIITLAADLSNRHEIVVIAETQGTIARALAVSGTRFQLVEPASVGRTEAITADDLLIDFGAFPEMVALADVDPRFLLWRVFPSIGCKGILGTVLFRQMFARLERQQSLVFMDGICHETACRELRRSFQRRILPLPIIVGQNRYAPKRKLDTIHITYIGRGTRMWKVKPLKKLVQDLGTIPDHRFHVHVFTDTDELFASELEGRISGNTEVEYHFGFTMDALSGKLSDISDLHYSMGTSALEGAILGIPTIIADAAHTDFPEDYRYRWLVEDLENYAGVFLENDRRPGRPLADMIAKLADAHERDRLSKETYRQACDNFSSDRITRSIESLAPRARLFDVLRFVPSYWRRRGLLRLR